MLSLVLVVNVLRLLSPASPVNKEQMLASYRQQLIHLQSKPVNPLNTSVALIENSQLN